jgi:hypothetical protein
LKMSEYKGEKYVRGCSLEDLAEYLDGKERRDLPMSEQQALYDRLQAAAGETKTPYVIPLFRVRTWDKNGVTKYHSGLRPSYSSTRGWWNRMTAFFDQSPPRATSVVSTMWTDGYINYKTVAGILARGSTVSYSGDPDIAYGYVGRGQAQSTGIWPGSGTTAESFNDYAPASKIHHGACNNHLFYFTTVMTNAYYSSTTPWRIRSIKRLFRNDGTAIVVREACMLNRGQYNTVTQWVEFRDLLTTPVSMVNGDWLEIEYAFRLNYPDGIGA